MIVVPPPEAQRFMSPGQDKSLSPWWAPYTGPCRTKGWAEWCRMGWRPEIGHFFRVIEGRPEDHSDSIESRAESMRGTTLSALKNRHLSLGPHLIYFSDSVPCKLVL